MNIKRFTALLVAALLCLSPLSAFAEDYNIESGDITVSANSGGQTVTQVDKGIIDHPDPEPVIYGGNTTNTVTIHAEEGSTAQVTFSGVNINNRYSENMLAAVTTSGQGDVTIELDGNNTLIGGYKHAGLQKENEGNLTIQDKNDTEGSLKAQGGGNAAGIGGGHEGDGSDITITGGTITATGGDYGAGIGGGVFGSGTNITITDTTVTANGGDFAAGIGGGYRNSGTGIEIVNSDVTAVGGVNAAGIGAGGGGPGGTGSDITISGDSEVSVAGGQNNGSFPAGPGIGTPGSANGQSTEIDPKIDNLNCTGSINYYQAGTNVSDIQNSSVEPTSTVTGEKHNSGEPEPENRVEPQIGVGGSYDEVIYCKDCGEELSREKKTIPALDPEPDPEPEPEPEKENAASGSEQEEDAFTRFCKNVAKQVREAPENGTVEVDATPWPGFQHRVFEALADRPDVTLIVAINLNGEEGKLMIPAGLDLLSSIGNAKVTTFEDLGKLLG